MVQLRNRNRNSINLQILHFRYGVPTSTRVQFPTQVLQMQTPSGSGRRRGEDYINVGDAHFRRDRMTQLIKCTPWSMRLCPHPTIIKKMKTFLEVENKMGLIPIPVPANKFRPPLPETNPNVRKSDMAEKRKRATPKKKFRSATPKITTMCPPILEAPPKPKSSTSSVTVREDSPWPSAGKMLGNLFKDRNWLLPKNYLVTENKKEDTNVASARPPLKEEPKAEEQATSPKAEKCGWGPDCPFCKSQKKEEESKQ